MAKRHALNAEAYSAFNRWDIDGVLAVMRENVDWPEASEGGRVIGKEAIRAYGTRQWTKIHPIVEPIEMTDHTAGFVGGGARRGPRWRRWHGALGKRMGGPGV